ncbi:hypothetical protein [Streptomyces sp. NPDC058086]
MGRRAPCVSAFKQPYYQQMKPLLDAYAEQVSHDINTEHPSGQLAGC